MKNLQLRVYKKQLGQSLCQKFRRLESVTRNVITTICFWLESTDAMPFWIIKSRKAAVTCKFHHQLSDIFRSLWNKHNSFCFWQNLDIYLMPLIKKSLHYGQSLLSAISYAHNFLIPLLYWSYYSSVVVLIMS